MRWRAAVACGWCALAACTFGDLGDFDHGAPAAPAPTTPASDASVPSGDANVELVPDGAAAGDDDAGPSADARADAPPPNNCDPEAMLLAGNKTNPTSESKDDTGGGYMDSFGFVATRSATAQCAFLYLDPPLDSEPAYVGVYSEDGNGAPATLLATAKFTPLVAGWNGAPLDAPLNITAGENLWLGVGAPAANIHYRYHKGQCDRIDHADKTADNGPANPFNTIGTFDGTCDGLVYLTP